MLSVLLKCIVGLVPWCCVGRAVLLCWWCGVVGVPLGRDSACISPHVPYCSLMCIGAPRIMLVLMLLRFHKSGGVPIMS